ncbi:MAG: hypothetical protein R3D00_08290 [Bacteroidia bacterium]
MSFIRILTIICFGLTFSLCDVTAGNVVKAKSKSSGFIEFAHNPFNTFPFAPDSLFEKYFNLLTYLATKIQEDSLYVESDEYAQLKSQQALIENNINETYNLDTLSEQEAYNLFEEQYQEYIDEGEPEQTTLTCLALYVTCLASGGSGKLCMLLYEICNQIGPPNPNYNPNY